MLARQLNTTPSILHSHIEPRNVRSWRNFKASDYEALPSLGIGFDRKTVARMIAASANDAALQPSVTTASIAAPVQYLQTFLPGFVRIVTNPRKIDELVGISTVGAWEDEQVIQMIMELAGTSVPYGDYTNVPFSSWNINFALRTVVRFEEGLRPGILETLRASRVGVDNASMKREAAAMALEIQRNAVGFFGYNNGANNTYGFLNDPALPAYITVIPGASSFTTWNKKTYLEIINDIRTAIVQLRTQSNDLIDPTATQITLALPTSVVDFLTVATDFGKTVRGWLTETFPTVRVVSIPELVGANGGANAFYLYAEKISDASTDDGRTFMQLVPSKFQMLGVSQQTKGYEEDYSNATAGVMCKRPWAITRFTGV